MSSITRPALIAWTPIKSFVPLTAKALGNIDNHILAKAKGKEKEDLDAIFNDSLEEFKSNLTAMFGESPFILSKSNLAVLEAWNRVEYHMAAMEELRTGIELHEEIEVSIHNNNTREEISTISWVPLTQIYPLSYEDFETFKSNIIKMFGESPIVLTKDRDFQTLKAWNLTFFELEATSELMAALLEHKEIELKLYDSTFYIAPDHTEIK